MLNPKDVMSTRRLVLASASPRRRELLTAMGVDFDICVADIDESRIEDELAEDFVIRLAREKAQKICAQISDENVAILAADTIVVQGERVFSKPKDEKHARRIWQALSGNKHQVMTAVCLLNKGKNQIRLSSTDVEFGRITDDQMTRYWSTGEPSDKAGAYAIQGFASAWVKQINGSYSNVVGLPLREVNQLLAEVGLNWL